MAEGEGSGLAGGLSEAQVKALETRFQQLIDERLKAESEARTDEKEGGKGEGEVPGGKEPQPGEPEQELAVAWRHIGARSL